MIISQKFPLKTITKHDQKHVRNSFFTWTNLWQMYLPLTSVFLQEKRGNFVMIGSKWWKSCVSNISSSTKVMSKRVNKGWSGHFKEDFGRFLFIFHWLDRLLVGESDAKKNYFKGFLKFFDWNVEFHCKINEITLKNIFKNWFFLSEKL